MVGVHLWVGITSWKPPPISYLTTLSHHLKYPPGDLIMIGDQDFDFSSSNNVYVAAASAAAEHYRGKND